MSSVVVVAMAGVFGVVMAGVGIVGLFVAMPLVFGVVMALVVVVGLFVAVAFVSVVAVAFVSVVVVALVVVVVVSGGSLSRSRFHVYVLLSRPRYSQSPVRQARQQCSPAACAIRHKSWPEPASQSLRLLPHRGAI